VPGDAVSEAVLLGDVIVVMGQRPATVLRIVPVGDLGVTSEPAARHG